MAAHVAERSRVEFRPHPALIDPHRATLAFRRLSTERRSANVAAAIGLAIGAAVLAIAWLYTTARMAVLRSGTRPLIRIALAAAICLARTVVPDGARVEGGRLLRRRQRTVGVGAGHGRGREVPRVGRRAYVAGKSRRRSDEQGRRVSVVGHLGNPQERQLIGDFAIG